MNKKVVIFDFDGTIADSEGLIRAMYDELSADRGWPELTDSKYKKLRKGTIQQAIKWVGVRPWQLPSLLREGRALFKKHSDQVKLFAGIDAVVKKLYEKNWEIYVLSSNSEDTIKRVLKASNIDKNMKILKRPALFGKSKSINKLIESEGYDRENVWMVGDELRDIEGGNKADVSTIAVAWGLQDISLLKTAGPTAIARKPNDILKILTDSLKEE